MTNYKITLTYEEMQMIQFAVKEQLHKMERWLEETPRSTYVFEQKKRWRKLTQKIIEETPENEA